jgi:hypothetical protein
MNPFEFKGPLSRAYLMLADFVTVLPALSLTFISNFFAEELHGTSVATSVLLKPSLVLLVAEKAK